MQYLKSVQDVQNPTEHIRFIQNSSKNSYRDRGFLLWKRRGKTMAKAEYRSAIRSRRLIQQAFADMLQVKAADKITVTDVVKMADINRGTFYAHYAGIPELIRGILEEHMQIIKDMVENSMTEDNRFNPRLIFAHVNEMLSENLDFYRKALTSGIGEAIMEQLRRLLMDFLLEYEDKVSDMDHDYYIFMISFGTGGAIALYRDWFHGKLPLSLEAVSDMAADVLCSMLGVE